MILESLTVSNFRVFKGEHFFDLSPRKKYKKKRPIILFGGLNGSGKTSILTAVRLVLYGKYSLFPNSSKKNYEEYLKKSIHKSSDLILQANSSELRLKFSYAHMGTIRHYVVKRAWVINGSKLIETLHIFEDGQELSELNYDQCQGFLNELIPIGISDLFFFDGEKISDLAKDHRGLILEDSIKKLLGLDVIEKLKVDLSIIQRNESKQFNSLKISKEISGLEMELRKAEEYAESSLNRYENVRKATVESETLINKLENELSSKGGAWAKSREEEISNLAKLEIRKENIRSDLINVLSGSYPVSIAKSYARKTLKKLEIESQHKKAAGLFDTVEGHFFSLEKKLKLLLEEEKFIKVKEVIDSELKKIKKPNKNFLVLHDISDGFLSTIKTVVDDAINSQHSRVKELEKSLSKIEKDLENTKSNIARSPEDAYIKPLIERIGKQQGKRASSLIKQSRYLQNHKRSLKEAIEITRKLDRLSETNSSIESMGRTLKYASLSQKILNQFSREMTARKVKDLECELVSSLHRLTKKEDSIVDAKIDSVDFSVKLFGQNGIELNKDDLSAGEQQIYAIAVLEALARTSGRKLPIIIDTPLGRLDSIHRAKLIKHYFPYASHQVIILSTDTEVDKKYYADFSRHVSHAYKLNYSPTTGSTTASEGYFWKSGQALVSS